MTENFCKGAIIKVIAGKEKNQIFIIKHTEDNYCYLVNGKTRKLNCPKKKNFKHLMLLKKESGIDLDKAYDCDVIKCIKDYIKSRDCK